MCVLSSHDRNLRVITSSTPISLIQKSIACVELSFDLLLPDDRDDDARRRAELPCAARAPRCTLPTAFVPPLLRIARRPATVRRPHDGVGLGVAGVHRELDQIDAGREQPLELAAVAPAVGPNMLPLVFIQTRAPCALANSIMSTIFGWSIGSPPPVQRIQAP